MAEIESRAFQQASHQSEERRILGLLCLLGALLLYTVWRGFAAGEFRILLAQTLLLAVALAYEACMLAAVRGALHRGAEIPPAMWALNVFAETQIPTAALFLLIQSQLMSPHQTLSAPAVLVYYFFIILSTLRLSPVLSLWTGLSAALGYLAVTAYVLTMFPRPAAEQAAFAPVVYFIYAGLFLAGGALAAFVAGQIRAHVSAALREAELKGELERVNHDLEVARSIQQGLLPARPPELDGFEVAGWNQPADQTGGDYFDWQTLPGGRVAISLADATGHGIGPALVGASCRAYARASFMASGGRDGVLDHLNRLLADDLESNRFVTFAVVFLEPASARVKVLSAGHGPILWYRRATDSLESLEAQGIPLGMIAGVGYEQGTEGRLAPGDFIALITDGVHEWENPEGEEFGLARLEAVLRRSRDRSAEGVIGELLTAVADFCQGTRQKDDLTAVILKRKADAPESRESADAKIPFSIDLQAQTRPEVPALQAGARS
ncbi:MAG: PP2C family protein-serine/threonine phosphatase [Pyrinomonadaceae bacterium]